MPNWVINELTLTGPSKLLRKIAHTDFDFEVIYPKPADISDWCTWAIANWGTKWSAHDIVITYTVGSDSMKILCRTAWGPPHGLLMYLTQKYPKLSILNHFTYYMEGSVGWGEYKDGAGKIHLYDPSTHKPSVLREFASRNKGWFDANRVLDLIHVLGCIDLEELERTGGDGPIKAEKSDSISLNEFIARK
jgi:hypothetical protein